MSEADKPTLPDYAGPCVCNIVPSLLDPTGARPGWFPDIDPSVSQFVLLVLDGLGWEQLRDHPEDAPTLSAMSGRSILTVAPSTTATALTSIASGLAPSQHGILGYRIDVAGDVLNILRWSANGSDARRTVPPEDFQATPPFLGTRPPVVTRAEFERSGFTKAHLRNVRFHGYRVLSTLRTEVAQLVDDGEPFVYAYYDGLDKVGHEFGLGQHYQAELRELDRLVADIIERLPASARLVVTADHGQVHVGNHVITVAPELVALSTHRSGEGRFRWFHTKPGAEAELAAGLAESYGTDAWVVTREQTVDEEWFGPSMSAEFANRLGDVALASRTTAAFDDPDDSGPFKLVGRHGSVTETEMAVPLLISS